MRPRRPRDIRGAARLESASRPLDIARGGDGRRRPADSAWVTPRESPVPSWHADGPGCSELPMREGSLGGAAQRAPSPTNLDGVGGALPWRAPACQLGACQNRPRRHTGRSRPGIIFPTGTTSRRRRFWPDCTMHIGWRRLRDTETECTTFLRSTAARGSPRLRLRALAAASSAHLAAVPRPTCSAVPGFLRRLLDYSHHRWRLLLPAVNRDVCTELHTKDTPPSSFRRSTTFGYISGTHPRSTSVRCIQTRWPEDFSMILRCAIR